MSRSCSKQFTFRLPSAPLLGLLVLAACSGPGKVRLEGGESQWRFARANLSATASLSGGTYAGALDVIWERKMKEKPQGPLNLAEGALTYTGAKRKLFFVDPQTGKEIGRFKSRACPQSGALVIDSLLYKTVAPPFNHFDCYRLRDGKRIWRSLVLDISAPLLAVGEKLIALGGDGFVYCVDRISGDLIWERSLGVKMVAMPAVDEKAGIVWVASAMGELIAIDSESGEVLYHRDISAPLITSPALEEAGSLFFSDKNGTAHQLKYGNLRDSTAEPSLVSYSLGQACWSAPAVSDGRVVFANNAGEVFCFSTSDMNSPIWRTSLGGALKADPIIVGEYVIVGLLDRNLYSLSLDDGREVSARALDYEIKYNPISDGDRIFVATQKGRLFCLGSAGTISSR